MADDLKIVGRRRGRPPGTGIDDSETLRKVALRLIQSPSLRPQTAIRQVVEPANDSIVRRLGRKWRQSGASLMSETRSEPPHQAQVGERSSNNSFAPGRRINMSATANPSMQYLDYVFGPQYSAVHEYQMAQMLDPRMQAWRDRLIEQMVDPRMQAVREQVALALDPERLALICCKMEAMNEPRMLAMREHMMAQVLDHRVQAIREHMIAQLVDPRVQSMREQMMAQ